MDEQRPQVTVSDPSLRGRPADVLGQDEDEPVRRRRWPYVLLAAAVLAGGLGARVAERRADERQRVADEQAVELVLDDRVRVQDDDGVRLSSRQVLLALDLELRNDGPLPVLLDRAVVGDFRFVGDVELAPGAEAQVQLVRTVTCPADGVEPPLDPMAEGLRVQVVTRTGDRTALVSPGVLPLDRLRSSARRACGFVPMEEAVVIALVPGEGLAAQLVVDNVSRRDLQLVGVQPAVGLRLAVPLRLPAPLPERSTTVLDLRLEPACSTAPVDLQGRPLPLPEDLVQVVVGAGRRRVGPLPARPSDDSALRSAYEVACS